MTRGRPLPSQMTCSLEFSPPLVRPIARGTSLFFLKARRRAVRLQMRAVDHDPIRLRAFARERHEDAVEDSKTAPAHEPVVQRLVRAVALRSILPLQPVPEHVDDPAHHPPVIHPPNTMRQRKERRYPRHLTLAQHKQIIPHSLRPETVITRRPKLVGREPSAGVTIFLDLDPSGPRYGASLLPAILSRERAMTPSLRNLQAAIARLPIVERRRTDPVAAAHIRCHHQAPLSQSADLLDRLLQARRSFHSALICSWLNLLRSDSSGSVASDPP